MRRFRRLPRSFRAHSHEVGMPREVSSMRTYDERTETVMKSRSSASLAKLEGGIRV
jgi:hypothetical protein